MISGYREFGLLGLGFWEAIVEARDNDWEMNGSYVERTWQRERDF